MVGKVILAFAGGMLSFLSPCVLPLVPGYISLMSGVSAAELTGTTKTKVRQRHVLRATVLFVAGFTLVFTALGAGASAIGQLLLDHQKGLNQVAGLLVIAMGLFLAGAFSPLALMRERRFQVAPDSLGLFAPPLMGMAFAFGWTPCIGPILTVVLATASTSATLGRGIALLVAYSLGLGVPFVATGIALGRLTSVFGWVKRHTRAINLIAGVFLVWFGFLLFTNRLHTWSSALIDFLEWLHLGRLARI